MTKIADPDKAELQQVPVNSADGTTPSARYM